MPKTASQVLHEEITENGQAYRAFARRLGKLPINEPEDVVQIASGRIVGKIAPPRYDLAEVDGARLKLPEGCPLEIHILREIRWVWGECYKRDVKRRPPQEPAADHELDRPMTTQGQVATAVRNEIAAILRDAMRSLSEQERRVLVARQYENRSCADIAVEMGKAEGSVKQLLAKARLKLKNVLTDRGYEP